MKEGHDFVTIYRINAHFQDLSNDIKTINTYEEFINGGEKRRAIMFDFLQIGELVNQLSDSFKNEFNNQDIKRLISIRNRIVHSYATTRDDIIFTTLKSQLPGFVEVLNTFSYYLYQKRLRNMLNTRIKIIIDKPIGFNEDGTQYPINCGYVDKTTTLTGKYQQVYIIDAITPLNHIKAKVVAIIHHLDEIEDILVASIIPELLDYSDISKIISFKEEHNNYELIY